MNKIIIPLFGIFFLTGSVQGAIHLAPRMDLSPTDLTYEEGATGNELVWQFNAHESADNPTTYSVTIDDVPLVGHIDASWSDNVDIVVNVDGLSLGIHIVEITVNDNGVDSNQAPPAKDTVTVTVVATGTSASSSTSTSSATNVPSSPSISTTISSETNVASSESTVNDSPVPLVPLISGIFFLAVLPKIHRDK